MRTLALNQSARPGRMREAVSLSVIVGLISVELGFVSSTLEISHSRPLWQDPIGLATGFARIAVVAFALFCVVAWPLRRELLAARDATDSKSPWLGYLALNLTCVAALVVVRLAVAGMADEPFDAHVGYGLLLLATGASQAFLLAPPRFWLALPRLASLEIAISLAGAAMVLGIGRLAQDGWDSLADATLIVSHWMLTLYEPSVVLVREEKLLGVGDFSAQIFAPCSGYEGAGLVVVFLAIYMWTFRRELRFPNVLLMFPLGIAAIWLLNAVRIAALISIGAHVSPAIAFGGFHSQAGWIAFLIVTTAAIALSRKVPYFMAQVTARPDARAAGSAGQGAALTLAYLAPFMALMAGSMLMSAFVPHDQWLYAVKVAGVSAAIWWFRDALRPLVATVSPLSIAVGLVIGVAWIATDPAAAGKQVALGAWLATLPASAAAVWLALRAFGSMVLVPIAEELAFRGYLHRALISARFETVPPGAFRPLAFTISTVAFAMMHERWLAAALAGAAYAVLMYRSNRLSDPIAAHMASNATIVLWAIVAEEWSLL